MLPIVVGLALLVGLTFYMLRPTDRADRTVTGERTETNRANPPTERDVRNLRLPLISSGDERFSLSCRAPRYRGSGEAPQRPL